MVFIFQCVIKLTSVIIKIYIVMTILYFPGNEEQKRTDTFIIE